MLAAVRPSTRCGISRSNARLPPHALDRLKDGTTSLCEDQHSASCAAQNQQGPRHDSRSIAEQSMLAVRLPGTSPPQVPRTNPQRGLVRMSTSRRRWVLGTLDSSDCASCSSLVSTSGGANAFNKSTELHLSAVGAGAALQTLTLSNSAVKSLSLSASLHPVHPQTSVSSVPTTASRPCQKLQHACGCAMARQLMTTGYSHLRDEACAHDCPSEPLHRVVLRLILTNCNLRMRVDLRR